MVIEQYIGTYNVPTDGISSIPLTKKSYDIEDPEVRYAEFTKSVKIPESPQVNKQFEHLFNLNVALQTFNPNIKATYRLIGDGVIILNGFCQLKKISNIDGKIYYTIQATGGVGGLFDSIGELELTDLDFSSLNHAWTEANIVSSWTPTLGQGYTYPMIDYGAKNTQTIWYVEDFKPAIFLKAYIDKIFSDAGYTYTSTFFASTLFKSLIIPQSSDTIRLSDATIEDRQFLVSRESTNQTGLTPVLISSLASAAVLIFNDASTAPNYNTGSIEYDITTGIYTVGGGRNINRAVYKAFLKLNFTYTQSSAGNTSMYQYYLDAARKVYIEVLLVRTRSSVETIIGSFQYDITDAMDGETLTSSYTSPNFTGAITSAEFDTLASDEYELRLGAIALWDFGSALSYVAFTGSEFSIVMQTDSQAGLVIRQTELLPGQTMVMNDTLQKDVKQKELLNAIIKRFNLYLQYDSTDANNIIIEPLVDFMEDTSVDVSSWIDDYKEREIVPLGALKTGKYIFTDQDDDDAYNKRYQERKNESYGTQTIQIVNDFQTATKTITSVFAPTPLWNAFRENDRIISSISYPRESGESAQETGKIRLLYWGGLLDTNVSWFIQSGAPTLRSTFPYAGHLDNPYDPDFDLNWGVTKLLFYDFSAGGLADIYYTDKNCYNTYWSKHINEITDKDSKIFICHLFLDFARYSNLNFQHKYYIDGSYWRLLEVSDFDIVNPKTTKCTFLKLKEADAFTGTQERVFGGGGVFSGGDEKPKAGAGERLGGSSGSGRDILYGENAQSDTRTLIFSDDVNSSGSEVIVSGSEGAQIYSGNAMIINSPNYISYRPYEAVVNNVFLEVRISPVFESTEFTTFNSNPYLVINDCAANEFINIKRAYIKTVTSGAISGGGVLSLRTRTTNTTLASTSASFFNTSNNIEELSLSANNLDLSEGVEIFQSSDMSGGAGTTVTLIIYFEIIKV